MNFYTNITRWGNNLLLREIANGERINRKIKYSPTLYCPVEKQTQYKTLDGRFVALAALFAFKIAFSTNVVPVSSTSGISISLQLKRSTSKLDNICLNSDIFPGFFVAKKIFIKP